MNLTNIQKDLIIGTLLGDGSLRTQSKGKTWRYSALQGEKQKDYLFHKYEILKPFCGTPPKEYVKLDKRYSKKSLEYSFATKTFTEFTVFAHKFYSFNVTTNIWVKDVPHDIEQFLTPRAIAYWFMDDGYLKRKWINYKTKTPGYYFNSLVFCTHSFSLEGVTRLQKALWKLYNLNFNIILNSKKTASQQYVLRLSNNQAIAFRELIKPFMLETLLYKLDF